MGGGALLQYEVDHPGTFEALIGFEPVYDNGVLNDEQVHGARDMLVAVSLAREGEWYGSCHLSPSYFYGVS
jgi:hypothetical protein